MKVKPKRFGMEGNRKVKDFDSKLGKWSCHSLGKLWEQIPAMGKSREPRGGSKEGIQEFSVELLN